MEKKLRECQLLDTNLKEIIDYLENQKLPQNENKARKLVLERENYEMIDGVLCRIKPTSHMIRKNELEFRIVLPNNLKRQILQNNHDSILCWSFGRKENL